jgi:hypothetical protein
MNTKSEPKYEYKFINSKMLVVDRSYQRLIATNRVKLIVSKFNPYLVSAIKVSCRKDGKYYVFDGQHTLAALKLKNKNQDLQVECKVYYDLSYEDECELFAEQTGFSKKVETCAKFKALYQGGDKDIVDLYDLLKSIGIEMNFSGSKGTNRIVCVGAVFKIFKKLTSREFADMFTVIRDSWNGIEESYNKEIIEGMYLFYEKYKNDFDRDKAVKQFGKVSPVVIMREGKTYLSGGNIRFARQLLYVYNNHLSSKRLPDRF